MTASPYAKQWKTLCILYWFPDQQLCLPIGPDRYKSYQMLQTWIAHTAHITQIVLTKLVSRFRSAGTLVRLPKCWSNTHADCHSKLLQGCLTCRGANSGAIWSVQCCPSNGLVAYGGEDGEVAIFKEAMLQDNRRRRGHIAVAGQSGLLLCQTVVAVAAGYLLRLCHIAGRQSDSIGQ